MMKKLLLLLQLFPILASAQLKKTVSFDGAGTSVSGLFQVYEYPSQTGNPSGCVTNSSAILQTTEWSSNGTKSAVVRLFANNCYAQYGNTRTEFTNNNYSPTQSGYDTTLRWWTWSWYFPSDSFPNDPNYEAVFAQWHDKAISPLTCSSSPPFAIEIKGGRFRAMVRYNPANPYCYNNSPTLQMFDMGVVPKDKRLDIIVNYYPKPDNTGYVVVRINDTIKLNYSGPCMYYGSAFPYFKLGCYKWKWDGTASPSPSYLKFFVDDVNIYGSASTLNDVDQTPTGGGSNVPPVVNAGTAQVVNNTTTTGALSGSATDPDGSISSYLWTQDSGPNTATFSNTTIVNPTLSGLIPGLYTFRLKATDNGGAFSSATVTFRVNLSPIIDVSGNSSLGSLPSNTVSINAVSSATDPDGSVTGYSWVQVEGPPCTIVSPTSQNTTINGLTAGTRRFTVTATDNNGDTDTGEVTVSIATYSIISVTGKGFKKVTVQN